MDKNVKEYYEAAYKEDPHNPDSPEKSNQSLANRVIKCIENSDDGKSKIKIVHLGAGIGIFESFLRIKLTAIHKLDSIILYSLDFASKLVFKHDKYNHSYENQKIKADFVKQPFRDNSMDIAVSNLAIEFGGEDALREINRVLRTNGKFYINLQNPNILNSAEFENSNETEEYKQTKKILINSPFKNESSIIEIFSKYGLKVTSIKIQYSQSVNSMFSWWEVEGIKI